MRPLVFCESQKDGIIHDLFICRDVYERQMVFCNPCLYQLGCMRYVQTFEQRQDDKSDAMWYIAGGMIFNLAAVVILIGIKYTLNIENEILNFLILMNGLIMITTAIPTKNNDGGRLLSLL